MYTLVIIILSLSLSLSKQKKKRKNKYKWMTETEKCKFLMGTFSMNSLCKLKEKISYSNKSGGQDVYVH